MRNPFYGHTPLNINFIKSSLIRRRKADSGKLYFLRWRLVNYLYTWIRFIKAKTWARNYGFDINEDFYCMICCKPVFKRRLECSDECYNQAYKESYYD